MWFKHTSQFWGIGAPTFIWVAALVLLVGTISCLIWLAVRVRQLRRRYGNAAAQIYAIGRNYPQRFSNGAPLSARDEVLGAFDTHPALRGIGEHWQAHCVIVRAADGEDEVWSTQRAIETLSDDLVLETQLNRSLYASIPGIVTGLGLLCTFLAILVALLDIRLQNEQVKGLDLLIEGLSGKFISSIVALLASTIFIFCEKALLHRLSRVRHDLARSLDALVPLLTPTQLLVKLTHDIGEQSVAFRAFNSDLANKLKQSMSESMKPTLERMADATEDLSRSLRLREQEKTESLTAVVEGLVLRLEASLNSSLGQLATRFQESLSSGATTQFEQVIASLGDAGSVLSRMSEQSHSTQRMLGELVTFARESTAEQLHTGRAQLDELNATLGRLMVQLNDSADSSVAKMSGALTAAMTVLSQEVTQISTRMTASVAESAGLATGTAKDIVLKAEEWTAQSAQRLQRLLEEHDKQLETVRGLRTLLQDSLSGFNSSLDRYAGVTAALVPVVTDVRTASLEFSHVARSAADVHRAIQATSTEASGQLRLLGEAGVSQRQIAEQMYARLTDYQRLFSHVEGDASKLLTQVAEHLQHYTLATKSGLEGLVKTADVHFVNATKRLGSSVEELEGFLTALSEELDRWPNRQGGEGNGHQRR